MKIALAVLTILLFSQTGQVCAQTPADGPRRVKSLRNNDVLLMVDARIRPETIIRKIEWSPCEFDIFPPLMEELKLRGVPEPVLEAMRRVPYGKPANEPPAEGPGVPPTVTLTIPAGTVVEVELPYTVSSADAEEGSLISLRVARRLLVDGATVIPLDSPATARVVKSREGKSWGRAGLLSWSMNDVVAADGTRVRLRYEEATAGGNKAGTVAAGTAATAAAAGLLLPPVAPLSVMWGFVKGDDALIPSGMRIKAVVESDIQVRAPRPEAKSAAYHDVNTLKAINEQKPADLVRLRLESILRR